MGNHAMRNENRRIFDYDKALLPNKFIAELESSCSEIESAGDPIYYKAKTGLTPGYPAWNLLYYSIFCSIRTSGPETILVETGTNFGVSTIVMAQALADRGGNGVVHTTDIDEKVVETARQYVTNAGLGEYVKFHVRDSIDFLREFVQTVPYIDLAFLDGNHDCQHVKKEFSIIYPKIVTAHGKVFFDNTTYRGVERALCYIRYAYGGNFIEFENSSANPNGNAIWQP